MREQWVIADIHGCARSLMQLVEEKIKPGRQDEIYLLGDYIDRGPDSRGVIDYIMYLQDVGYQVFPLMGNHEDVLLRCYAQECAPEGPVGMYDLKENWLYFGGRATLKSFGVKNLCEIPPHYLRFLSQLPYYYKLDNFVLAHAGLNFGLADPFSDKLSMLWIKDYTVDRAKIQGRRLLHGHVPYTLGQIQRQLEHGHAISLDNGCVYQKSGMSNLIALEINKMELQIQANVDFGVQKHLTLAAAA